MRFLAMVICGFACCLFGFWCGYRRAGKGRNATRGTKPSAKWLRIREIVSQLKTEAAG